MKIILFLLLLCAISRAQDAKTTFDPYSFMDDAKPSAKSDYSKPAPTYPDTPTRMGTLEINNDTYGPGKNSDQFGRPTRYEVIGQPKANTDFMKVKGDAYGDGIGMDQFGRPVKAKPAW